MGRGGDVGVHSDANPLEGLLARSRSSNWNDRANVADELGRHASEPEAFERLVEMLDDADEAVIGAAARAMLVRTGAEGAEVVFMSLAAGEAEVLISDDVEVSEAIHGVLTRMGFDGLAIRHIAEGVADDQRLVASVRAAARAMAQRLPP